MDYLYEWAVGLVLGFSLTIPPGPMNALIATRSASAYRRGVVTGLGAMSSDALLAVIVFVLSQVISFGPYLRVIYAIGAVVMGFLAYRVLTARPAAAPASTAAARDYTTALAIGLSNPFQILWWLTAGLGFAYLGGAALLAGLFGAIAIWITSFPYALAQGARRIPSFERAVTYVSGALLVVFVVYFAVLAF